MLDYAHFWLTNLKKSPFPFICNCLICLLVAPAVSYSFLRAPHEIIAIKMRALIKYELFELPTSIRQRWVRALVCATTFHQIWVSKGLQRKSSRGNFFSQQSGNVILVSFCGCMQASPCRYPPEPWEKTSLKKVEFHFPGWQCSIFRGC